MFGYTSKIEFFGEEGHFPLTIAVLLCSFSLFFYHWNGAKRPLPPGPRGLPLIGNMHQLGAPDRWRVYQEWHKVYGPIISVKQGLKTLIILGTYKTTRDLLDKRSEIYSSRPNIVVATWLSRGYNTTALPYGRRWRNHHRIQAALLNRRMSQKYQRIQDIESRQLLAEMLQTDNFIDVFHRFSSSLIFTLAYGKRLTSCDQEDLREADQILGEFVYACHQFKFLENFPWLNVLPRWVARWKYWGDGYHERTMNFFKNKFKEGEAMGSWNWSKEARKMNEAAKDSSHIADFAELAYVVGILHEAASHTTDKALQFAIMACVLHPDAVLRAQQELDRVIGTSRLPDFEDIPNLPYVGAFINETQRWRPLTLEGVAHATTRDDEYMGFHIPNGTIVTANHWSLDMDEELFPAPDLFKPERWLDNPELPLSTFGFGRRVCAGQTVAQNSLLIVITRLLWAYEISHAYDDDGTRVEVDSWSMVKNISTKPMPFRASFRVRSAEHESVIRTAWQDAEKDPDVILQSFASR